MAGSIHKLPPAVHNDQRRKTIFPLIRSNIKNTSKTRCQGSKTLFCSGVVNPPKAQGKRILSPLNLRDPNLQIIQILGPKACKSYLLWAIWIFRGKNFARLRPSAPISGFWIRSSRNHQVSLLHRVEASVVRR